MRGYNHQSPITVDSVNGSDEQVEYVDTLEAQMELLRAKRCGCSVE